MKYFLLLIVGLLPLSAFAQHRCNENIKELSQSIQLSIKQKSSELYILNSKPERLSVGCSNGVVYYIDGVDVVSNGINLPGTYVEYKWIDNMGTPASIGNYEINHLNTSVSNSNIFRRSTPYGYYPTN